MDIDPAALSTLASGPKPSTTSTTTNPSALPPPPPTPAPPPKQPKLTIAPRLDLEPYYTGLRAGLGTSWPTYTSALSQFLRGALTQSELSAAIDLPLAGSATSAHAHNQLIVAVIANCFRDLPDAGVAGFVSATEGGTVTLKAGGGVGGGDRQEGRLKREVRGLGQKERRRVKDVGREVQKEREREGGGESEGGPVADLRRAGAGRYGRVPDLAAAAAGVGAIKSSTSQRALSQ